MRIIAATSNQRRRTMTTKKVRIPTWRTLKGPVAMCVAALSVIFVQGCADLYGPGVSSATRFTEAPRVELSLFQGSGSGRDYGGLYAYRDPLNTSSCPNVFRMSGGRIISVTLRAGSKGGRYDGDKLFIADLTNRSDTRGQVVDIGVPVHNNWIQSAEGAALFTYDLKFVPKGDDMLVALQDVNGPSATLSINSLYRWRLQKGGEWVQLGDRQFWQTGQGGAKGCILLFPKQAVEAAKDDSAGPSKLTPTYVVFVARRTGVTDTRISDDIPIGDSGYVIHWTEEGVPWTIQKAE